LQEQAAIAKKADPSVQPRGGTETILVVEDETPVRSLAKRLLERRGYRVLEAGSGVQALEVWAARRQEIDLVLTDVVMPEGMSGRDLVERLLEEKPGLKFIYSTGYNPEQSRLYTGPVEPINLLPKPYDPRQLLETVRACLDHIEQGAVK
jgi:CheY-like chemotaxis protein